MFNKLKFFVLGLIGVAVIFSLMNPDKNGSGTSHADLDQVLSVAANTMSGLDNSTDVNQDNAMDKFAQNYSQGLNSSQPAISNTPIGVAAQKDGSFTAFNDTNNNLTKDEGEKDLFNLEIDSENERLIASDETGVREHGFSFSGLFMGMMIGNLLSRQRATGANPASRKATPKAAYRKSRAQSTSARSRAGSGSHSSGK